MAAKSVNNLNTVTTHLVPFLYLWLTAVLYIISTFYFISDLKEEINTDKNTEISLNKTKLKLKCEHIGS